MTPVEQLVDQAGAIISALTPFVGVVDDHRLDALAVTAVGDLCSRPDLAAEACQSIMSLLWPHAQPEDCGRSDWWRTPLGRLCAHTIIDDRAITYASAASMLGVQRGTVSVMAQRGTLARHHDGGVVRSAVLQRLGQP